MKPRHEPALWEGTRGYPPDYVHSEIGPVRPDSPYTYESWALGGEIILRRNLDDNRIEIIFA